MSETLNKSIDEIYPKILYHYTSFDKFKDILQYGTLRFKLSSQSNDMLDTRYIIDVIKITEIIDDNSLDGKLTLLKFLIGYFQHPEYKSSYSSFVTCFTDKEDSRLLWDAYTVNRPTQEKCELGKNKYCQNKSNTYNGVCIGFKRNSIRKLINKLDQSKDFNQAYLTPIWYTNKQRLESLSYFIDEAFNIFEKSKSNPDQSQNIIPPYVTGFQGDYEGDPHYYEIKFKKCFLDAMFNFITNIECRAPIFKHEFWNEENEFRAVLCRHNQLKNDHKIVKGTSDNQYIDISFDSDMIDHLILGPTFSSKDADELKSLTDAKIDFSSISKIPSRGTNIIVMR